MTGNGEGAASAAPIPEVLTAALRYLPRTIPLMGKAPSVGNDWPRWSATRESVTDWYRRRPDHNVGIRTGSGLVALDIDAWDGGFNTLAVLEFEHGALPPTPTVITGTGGQHRYFRDSGDQRSRNLRSIGLRGLELSARGRQLVAPPSVHPDTGREYVWSRPLITADLAPLPAWLAVLAGGDRPPSSSSSSQVSADRGDDPLHLLPASVYVPILLGVDLGRDHFVRCPFHEEQEPSLHVYEGNRGWFCFGCGRGGSIIDFGAALFELEPRGRSYLELRRRLAAALLEASR